MYRHPWSQNIGRNRKEIERIGRRNRWEAVGHRVQGSIEFRYISGLRNDRVKYPNHQVNNLKLWD